MYNMTNILACATMLYPSCLFSSYVSHSDAVWNPNWSVCWLLEQAVVLVEARLGMQPHYILPVLCSWLEQAFELAFLSWRILVADLLYGRPSKRSNGQSWLIRTCKWPAGCTERVTRVAVAPLGPWAEGLLYHTMYMGYG